jgi:hypothetical protein
MKRKGRLPAGPPFFVAVSRRTFQIDFWFTRFDNASVLSTRSE